MKIPSGSTDRKIAFVAVDATDLKTRETGLTSFTVYRSRDGGTATIYTTPTVAELSAANMPGVYVLTIDEDTTIGSGHDMEEYVVHITQASMAPVTRAILIERVKITEGETVTAASGAVDADIERLQGSAIATPSVAGVLEVDVTHWIGTAAATPTIAGVPEVDLTHVGGATTNVAALATNVDAILTDTGTTLQAEVDGIQADTEDIQARLPAALVSGRMDASVGAMAANVVTAAAIATDAIDADAIAAGAIGVSEAPNLDAAVSSRATPAQVNAEVVDVLKVDVLAEPGQAVPPTTGVATMEDAMRYLYFALTNRADSDAVANFLEFYNRAASAVQWKKPISDAASIFTEGTGAAGP